MVEVKQLEKFYGGNSQRVCALDKINLKIHRGEFVAIIGPSGSGKSTFLNMVGALDRPSSGDVIINGQSISSIKNLDHFRSLMVGFIFQTHNLIPTLTALENVQIPMAATRASLKKKKTRSTELLDLVGLNGRMNHLPNMMSGGERQRVAVARALANQPSVILADEPTGNLDTQNTLDIMKLLDKLNREQNVTILVVTHNHEVARMTHRVVTMRDGKIHQDISLQNEYQRDLFDFKNSSLGQAILHEEFVPDELKDIAPKLRDIFQRI